MLTAEETHLLELLCTCQPENVALAETLAKGLDIDMLALLKQEGFFELGLESFSTNTWTYFEHKEAYFHDLEGEDLRALKYFRHIECLKFKHCRFQTLAGIEFLPNLCEFSFVGGLISDFSGIAKASKSLLKMTLQFKNLQDLLWCEHVPQLEYLNCDYNKGISTLEGIEQLKKLKFLSLRQCNLSSLCGVEQCESLEKLDVEGNKIEALYPLYQLPTLKKVDVMNNYPLSKAIVRNYRLAFQEKVIILNNKL
jgi:hypothetical protein